MDAFIAGAWRSPKLSEVFVGGQWRALTRYEAYINGAWRSVAAFVPSLTVSIAPSPVSTFAYPSKPIAKRMTTEDVLATPSGGFAPFSYSWDGGNSPANAVNTFTRTIPADSDFTESFTVTVTDALGSTASATVDVQYFNYSSGGLA